MSASLKRASLKQRRPGQRKVADLIKKARLSGGFSLRELALRASTSHSTIAAYEQARKVPSAEVLLRLINACGLDFRVHKSSRLVFSNPYERGEELVEVLNLAEQFPARHRGKLEFPRFIPFS